MMQMRDAFRVANLYESLRSYFDTSHRYSRGVDVVRASCVVEHATGIFTEIYEDEKCGHQPAPPM